MLTSTKPPKCPVCKRRTADKRERLHSECVEPWITRQTAKLDAARKRKAAMARRQERENVKVRKEKLKSPSEWEEECRRIVQKLARIRDRFDGCISCHMGPNYGGQWHGSHYRSVGACSNLQLHLWNIHKACAQCNLHKSGNREGYVPRLVAKIGADRVAWLDAQNDIVKRSGPAYIEYLMRFKRVMGKRLRRMEKRARA